jgi:(p)ppGpp synthase/HD superfamily hydrolase
MELASRFADAVSFALGVHAGQVRKGTGIPYITHPLAVASITLEYGASEDEAIAGVLHDAIEDSRRPLETKAEIRSRFGAGVAEIVEGCSDSETKPKLPWRERKERHLEHLRTVAPSVLLVAAADKAHNARSILKDYQEVGEALWDRFSGKKDGTLWYCAYIGNGKIHFQPVLEGRD